MQRFENKVAIVSGGNQGIGYAVVQGLIQEGATVIVGDINDHLGPQCEKNLGAHARFVHLDVTQEGDWQNIFSYALNEFGKVDILVNNAGIVGSGADIEHETLDGWRQVTSVNMDGTFLGTKYAMKHMHGGGAVVNINSMGGVFAEANTVAYSASKGSIRMITRSAALYGAQKENLIRVNSVHPAATTTEMLQEISTLQPEIMAAQLQKIPLKRFAEPQNIASAVLYMASDEARYITGTEIFVDGGQSAGF